MPISIPKFFQKAFAQNGGRQDVPVTGDTSGGRASYDVGFPPVTRTPIIAGGIPPFGTDFNGVLYDLSQAIQYVQSGVAFPFNQDFATAIGGYEIGAIVSDPSNKSLLWINGTASNIAFPTGWTQFTLGQATETLRGVLRVGTQAEVNAGTLDTVGVTPKKFVDAFKGSAVSLSPAGYQKLPGGLIIQWGYYNGSLDDTSALINYPIAFPNSAFSITVTAESDTVSTGSNFIAAHVQKVSPAQFRLFGTGNFTSTAGYSWIAIGY